jgi:hyperosmotically inducible protein
VTPTPVDANSATASNDSKPVKSQPSNRTDRHLAKARSGSDGAGIRVASASNSNASPAGASADSQQVPVQAEQEASAGAGSGQASVEPAAADSQITASVKSEIATAAPNSAVDVTTTNGVVALAGSVSSQDAADQATQAAQRVPGVQHVDASALTVSNQ